MSFPKNVHILNLVKMQIPICGRNYPYCINLFGDSRSLRFSCAGFGWRIFYCREVNMK